MRGILIGAQMALCTMLLIPAGLLSRALHVSHTFDPGFDYDNVAVVSIDLRGPRYENNNAAIFIDQWLEREGAAGRRGRVARGPRAVEPRPYQGTVRLDEHATADEAVFD